MAGGMAELNVDLARQRAVNLIFDEYQKVPERPMELIDYKEIRRNWVATFKNQEFPDHLVIVEYDAAARQTHTHLYQRRTRSSAINREAVLFEI